MTEKKHSDFLISEYFKLIQNLITRMAQNSFLIKAWSISLITGLIFLTISFMNPIFFYIILVLTLFFWFLDSYYLGLEKSYRRLYNLRVKQYNNNEERENFILFDLNLKSLKSKANEDGLKGKKFPLTMFSLSEILFYTPILISIVFFLITFNSII